MSSLSPQLLLPCSELHDSLITSIVSLSSFNLSLFIFVNFSSIVASLLFLRKNFEMLRFVIDIPLLLFLFHPKILRPLRPQHGYMIIHFPFSAHGLFFLSGAWISGSFFSFSSTYSRILETKLYFTRTCPVAFPLTSQILTTDFGECLFDKSFDFKHFASLY